MTQINPGEQDEPISVKDMKDALADEIREVMKDAQLRIQEFSALAAAYAAGEITPHEATDRYMEYKDKWGDPLPGVKRSSKYLSDEEIVADMNKAFGPFTSREQTNRRPQPGAGKQDRIPE
jgi:hypothetical protein